MCCFTQRGALMPLQQLRCRYAFYAIILLLIEVAAAAIDYAVMPRCYYASHGARLYAITQSALLMVLPLCYMP